MEEIDTRIVLKLGIALLLAIRCRQQDAAKQLLAEIYHKLDEPTAKTMMNRLIYLVEPAERDWLRRLCG